MTSAVPKCFHFPIIPLTVDHGISSRDEISEIDLLQSWHPITVPRLNSNNNFLQIFMNEFNN